MDYTEVIRRITTEVTKQMELNGITIEEIDWVLTQVKNQIYANTPVKIIDYNSQ